MYSHYWAYQPSHPAYAKAWPTILDDTRRIIEHVRQAGTVIAGPDGHRRPILDPTDGVEFNGDATSDLDGEPFQLLAPLSPVSGGTPTATAFCKTSRKPYDLAVAAVLLRCTMLVPEAFAVSASTGGARTVVADLFGAAPAGNPLRPTLADIRFEMAGPCSDTAAAAPAAGPFEVGQQVHVDAYGNWRPGTVTKVGRTRITVTYVRNADGDTDERAFPVARVQPADGVALVPVHRLRRGQVVILADRDATVADVRGGPRRYRTVVYTDGTQAEISAQTVMRVRIPTPTGEDRHALGR